MNTPVRLACLHWRPVNHGFGGSAYWGVLGG